MAHDFTLLFLWPRTAVLDAVRGILGTAVATQIRADPPLMSHVLSRSRAVRRCGVDSG